MKKFTSLIFLIFIVMVFTGCRSKPFYSNRSEVTLEKINEKTVPTVMASYKGSAQIDRTVTARDSEIKFSFRYVNMLPPLGPKETNPSSSGLDTSKKQTSGLPTFLHQRSTWLK